MPLISDSQRRLRRLPAMHVNASALASRYPVPLAFRARWGRLDCFARVYPSRDKQNAKKVVQGHGSAEPCPLVSLAHARAVVREQIDLLPALEPIEAPWVVQVLDSDVDPLELKAAIFREKKLARSAASSESWIWSVTALMIVK
jgi:hypothetical protein